MDLSQIRKKIDSIDDQIAALLCERLTCSQQVAQYKQENGIAVLNEAREQEVLARVAAVSDALDTDKNGYARANALVYSTVMEVSRALQHRMLGAGHTLRERLEKAPRELIAASTARVVCQGTKGAFSHQAARMLFDGAQPQFVDTWDDVLDAVTSGGADYGLLPVENSSTGSVHEVFDRIMANRCHIAAAVEVPVRHCLLGVKGARLEDVQTVVSHSQALSQCRAFIREHNFVGRPYANTAMAAQWVAQQGDRAIAAISSAEAATEWGLDILANDIQSFDGNTTRFVAVSRELYIPADANRITLLFCLPHVTGSLYHTLARFALEGLNLTKLESRPLKNGSFEYAFYLDFEGDLKNENTVALLCALAEELPQFTLLGHYRER